MTRLFSGRHTLPPSVRKRYEALELCQGWTRSEVARFDSVADLVEYEPGDVILGQGLSRPEVVVLIAGRAVRCDLSTGLRLGPMEVGGVAGDHAVLGNAPQPFSVIATGYAAALHVPGQALRSLLPTHAGLQRLLVPSPRTETATAAVRLPVVAPQQAR
jgi:hypothetical protein